MDVRVSLYAEPSAPIPSRLITKRVPAKDWKSMKTAPISSYAEELILCTQVCPSGEALWWVSQEMSSLRCHALLCRAASFLSAFHMISVSCLGETDQFRHTFKSFLHQFLKQPNVCACISRHLEQPQSLFESNSSHIGRHQSSLSQRVDWHESERS
jgi:hypothetical protein